MLHKPCSFHPAVTGQIVVFWVMTHSIQGNRKSNFLYFVFTVLTGLDKTSVSSLSPLPHPCGFNYPPSLHYTHITWLHLHPSHLDPEEETIFLKNVSIHLQVWYNIRPQTVQIDTNFCYYIYGPITVAEIMQTQNQELDRSVILSDTPAEISAPNLPKVKAMKGCTGL